MTLQELEQLPKEMLVPTDIAPIIGCTPYRINVVTRDGKNPFPFPVIRMGTRVRIPKKPFIKAMRGEDWIGEEIDEVVEELRKMSPDEFVKFKKAFSTFTQTTEQ